MKKDEDRNWWVGGWHMWGHRELLAHPTNKGIIKNIWRFSTIIALVFLPFFSFALTFGLILITNFSSTIIDSFLAFLNHWFFLFNQPPWSLECAVAIRFERFINWSVVESHFGLTLINRLHTRPKNQSRIHWAPRPLMMIATATVIWQNRKR